MTKTHDLAVRLAAQKRCPVCGEYTLKGGKTSYGIARFECGAVFAVSSVAEAIVATEPCPSGSNVQASQLTMEAFEKKAGAA